MRQLERGARRWLSIGLAVACGALAVVAPDWQEIVRAQGYYQPAEDHLECFKVRDTDVLRGLVDLESPIFGLQGGCRVSNAQLYCTPVAKTVEQLFNGPTPVDPLPVPGFPALGDRICYKVRCPARRFPDRVVTDQFGTRSVGRFKAALLCTPTTNRLPCRTACCYLGYLGTNAACLQYTGLGPQVDGFKSNCNDVINVFGVVGEAADGPCGPSPFGGTCVPGPYSAASVLPSDSSCSP